MDTKKEEVVLKLDKLIKSIAQFVDDNDKVSNEIVEEVEEKEI